MRWDRVDIGVFLIFFGGILSFFSISAPNVQFLTVEETLGWYSIVFGLSVLVILGAILVLKGHVDLGCMLAFVPSVLGKSMSLFVVGQKLSCFNHSLQWIMERALCARMRTIESCSKPNS